MQNLPFPVHMELAGWDLYWARLIPNHDPAGADALADALAGLRETVVATVLQEHGGTAALASHPTVAALRRLFRAAGTDPTRYRPSSEALLRRLLKGDDLPVISPLVDLNNCLSARLAVPCCVTDEATMVTPLTFRRGAAGEEYLSMRGPFNLEGRPLLLDAEGPFDAPITGSERAKVRQGTEHAWLTAYLPHGVVAPERADEVLRQLVAAAPVATIDLTAASIGAPA